MEYGVKLRGMERQQRLLESAMSTDWVGSYLDIFDRVRSDPLLYGSVGYNSRRYGRNIPIFRSEQELRLLRVPSQLLVATNTYAQGLIEGLTSYVLGAGMVYRMGAKTHADAESPLIKAMLTASQHLVDSHLVLNQWFGGEQPGIEEEAFQKWRIDGEFILIDYPQSDGTVQTRIMDADQLTQKPGTDFREWGFGVCTDPRDVQRPLAYWIQHGDDASDGEEYMPDELIHCRANVPRNVKRGLPDFVYDTRDALSMAGRLRTAMAHGTTERAAHSIVTKVQGKTQDQVGSFLDKRADYQRTDPVTGRAINMDRVRPGTRLFIGANEEFVQMPGIDPAAVAVLNACVLSAGGKWNAPPWIYGGDAAATTSYASSLTAESPFVRTTIRRQRPMCEVMRRSVWGAVRHACAIAGGLLVCLPDGAKRMMPWEYVEQVLELQVEAPSPSTADPLKDEQISQIRNQAGVLSPQTWQQQAGLDPDREQANWDQYRERNPNQGMPLTVPPGFGGPAGA
jgi:hypothetical protein